MIGTSNIIRSLTVAIQGCSHMPADFAVGRSATSIAISNYERRASRVDLVLDLGDFSSNQNPTEIATYSTEGENCALQLNSGVKYLDRNKIYTLRGNHDPGDGNNDWYDRYID